MTSLLDVSANFEQMRSEGQEGLEIPVTDLTDASTNFERLGVPLPHIPVQSLGDASRNFEVLSG